MSFDADLNHMLNLCKNRANFFFNFEISRRGLFSKYSKDEIVATGFIVYIKFL